MTRFDRVAVAGCLALAAVAASACTPTDARGPVPSAIAPAPSPSSSRPAATGLWHPEGAPGTLAQGLASPWSVVAVDGGALLSQRDDGAILELTPRGEVRTVGTVPGVVSGGESGLHGLAVLVDGSDSWLYAYHGAQHDNRVVRMPLRGRPGQRTMGDGEVVFSGIPRANTHNGGRLAFGPDGYLYVATGDARDTDSAQDPQALGGKILRLTPEGKPAPGNPFDGPVWSLGHRNVQGLAWTADGTLWASEFGQDTWDELNRIEAGGNYGWPVVEGPAEGEGMIGPVAWWPTDEASPSGIAAIGDTVFIAGLRGERLWVVDTAGGELVEDPFAVLTGEQGRLRDVVAAPDGGLWILTSNTDGRGDPRPEDDLLLHLRVTPAT